MKTKEQLEAEIAPLRKQLHRLRDLELKERSVALLGRCFKYRNCYSLPKKPSDYWWLYVKVVSVNYWPVTFEFQTDRNGRIEVKQNKCASGLDNGNESYTEISQKEFAAAWNRLQKHIGGMKP